MFSFLSFSWLINLVSNFIEAAFTKANHPNIAAYIDEASRVIVPIVQTAEDSGAAGPQKKAAAVAALTNEMQTRGLDLPGDLEANLASMVVEQAVALLQKKGGSFFSGLEAELTTRLSALLPSSPAPSATSPTT